MDSINYSNSSSAGNFLIDWNTWSTVPINTWRTITTSGWNNTTSGTYIPGWQDVPNPPEIVPIPGQDDIIDSLRQLEQAQTLNEIQQRMALADAVFLKGVPKKVFPRKPLRMIRLRENA